MKPYLQTATLVILCGAIWLPASAQTVSSTDLSAMATVASAAPAQYDFRHTVRIGIGIYPLATTNRELVYQVGLGEDVNPYYDNTQYNGNKTYYPSLYAAYAYRIKRWLSIEGGITYAAVSQNTYDLFTDKVTYRSRDHYIGIAPTVRFHWYNSRIVSLYSSVGVGVACYIEHGRNIYPSKRNGENYYSAMVSADLTYFGISVGRKWYGFAELSVGTRGLVCVGAGYRFNNSKHAAK